MEHKFDLSNLLKVYKALIWITLYAALHFFDNVYFFFQYQNLLGSHGKLLHYFGYRLL